MSDFENYKPSVNDTPYGHRWNFYVSDDRCMLRLVKSNTYLDNGVEYEAHNVCSYDTFKKLSIEGRQRAIDSAKKTILAIYNSERTKQLIVKDINAWLNQRPSEPRRPGGVVQGTGELR